MGTCLSSNVVKMYIRWSSVTKLALGATYHRYTSKDQYSCIGTTSDICYLHCDEGSIFETFNCNSAGICIFSCETDACADFATIHGNNANTLTVKGDANRCIRSTIINAPTNGNLTFNRMTADKAYTRMTVRSGSNTDSIYIDCTYAGSIPSWDYIAMQIHAQTAQFLKVVIGNAAVLDGDIYGATLYCPRDSNYNGPEEAPCVIQNDGVMESVDIDAYYGTPRDVVYYGSGSRVDVNLHCYKGTTTDFGTNSLCYITHPRPTRSPFTPTHTPSDNPSAAPTDDTDQPTPAPTIPPTDDGKQTTNETVYVISIIICLSCIVLYLLYRFKEKIATLLFSAANANVANLGSEVNDDIQPGADGNLDYEENVAAFQNVNKMKNDLNEEKKEVDINAEQLARAVEGYVETQTKATNEGATTDGIGGTTALEDNRTITVNSDV